MKNNYIMCVEQEKNNHLWFNHLCCYKISVVNVCRGWESSTHALTLCNNLVESSGQSGGVTHCHTVIQISLCSGLLGHLNIPHADVVLYSSVKVSFVKVFRVDLRAVRMDGVKTQMNGESKPEKCDDAHSTSSSHVCGGCGRKLRSLLPVNYKEEVVHLLKLAGPVVRINL